MDYFNLTSRISWIERQKIKIETETREFIIISDRFEQTEFINDRRRKTKGVLDLTE